ncbi:MAG: tetratricopeptide repeat protein [Bacteroidota bacterium]
MILGQQSLGAIETNQTAYFSLFQQGRYQEVVTTLDTAQSIAPGEYLIFLISKQQLGEDKKVELVQWTRHNPMHSLRSLAAFHISSQAFSQGDTLTMDSFLSEIDKLSLDENAQGLHSLMVAEQLLRKKAYKKALENIEKSKHTKLVSPLLESYYRSLCNFYLGNYDIALAGFKEVAQERDLFKDVGYFIMSIYFQKEAYQKAIDEGSNFVSQGKSLTHSRQNQLMGEAYAKLENTEMATRFFDKAIQTHPRAANASLLYQAGVASFKIGKREKAIKYFTQSGIADGPHAILSALQLGRLYALNDDLENALTSFLEASTADDVKVREEALAQATIIYANLGRFKEAIDFSQDYLAEFPSGKAAPKIKNLLPKLYLSTSAFHTAIDLLEKEGIIKVEQEITYQKVTYRQAVLDFNDGNFAKAQRLFIKSLRFPTNQDLANESFYHLGEINALKGKYVAAISAYKEINPITALGQYGLGYAYFNLRKYREAIKPFQNAASNLGQDDLVLDANLRLADCKYAVKEYEEALRYYRKIPQSNYTIFQQGMTLRNMEESEAAIDIFRKLGKGKPYAADGLFYIAQICFEQASFQQAENAFTEFLETYQESPLTTHALLNRAVSRTNLGKYEAARDDYIFLLGNFPTSEIAYSAILGLQELQQRGVRVSELPSLIEQYKQLNPSLESLEVIEFEAAKSYYSNQEYPEAIQALEAFLIDYPNSKNALDARFLMGEVLYKSGELGLAKDAFTYLRTDKNRYSDRVLNRLGEINLTLGENSAAVEVYELLFSLDLSPKSNQAANEGLLNAYYSLGDFPRAIQKAETLLQSDETSELLISKARNRQAFSYLSLEDTVRAQTIFSKLADGKGKYAVEANYQLALLAYLDADFDASLEQLFALTAGFGSYTEWVEKSYLLIAENYISKGEIFQAKATLNSIIQHAELSATKRSAEIKLQEIQALRNSDSTSVKVNE